MKKANQFVLLLFFIIILSIPGYWVFRGKPSTQVSIVEGRVLGLPENSYPTLKIALDYIKGGEPEKAFTLVWDLYTGGSLQKKIDGAATDQFPFRLSLIKFAKYIDRQIIRLSYYPSGDTVIPADMTSDIYIMLEHDALILPPGTTDEEDYEKIDARLTNYRILSKANPDIHFFIFYLESIQYSQYHPLNTFFSEADNGSAFEYFKDNLTENVQLGYMPLKSLDDYLHKYFRTDHHWNTFGILEAYDGIVKLLAANNKSFPPKLGITNTFEFPEIEFLGSLARKTLYPIDGDKLIGFQAEFPDCTVSDDGIEGDYDFQDEYLNGEIPETPYIDHYGLYFGSQNGLLEYDCETQSSTGNILIIGDSYTRPLVSLIAAHYLHTYFIDLRQNPEFTLSSFLNDHKINDILITSDYEIVFLNTDQWYINP